MDKNWRSRFGGMDTKQPGKQVATCGFPGKDGEHHITIPNHKPLKVGTMNGILGDVASHLENGARRSSSGAFWKLTEPSALSSLACNRMIATETPSMAQKVTPVVKVV